MLASALLVCLWATLSTSTVAIPSGLTSQLVLPLISSYQPGMFFCKAPSSRKRGPSTTAAAAAKQPRSRRRTFGVFVDGVAERLRVSGFGYNARSRRSVHAQEPDADAEPLLGGRSDDGNYGDDDGGPSCGFGEFFFGGYGDPDPPRRARASVAHTERLSIDAATNSVRRLFSRITVAARTILAALAPSTSEQQTQDDVAPTGSEQPQDDAAPTGSEQPTSSQDVRLCFPSSNCAGARGFGAGGLRCGWLSPEDFDGMMEEDKDLPAVIFCADCNLTRCSACDLDAHSDYSTIHPQRVATYPDARSVCLDCNEFLERDGTRIEYPLLPSRELLGNCVNCKARGKQSVSLLASKEGGLIPIWTCSGLATKVKPIVFCHDCGFEECLGPAGASKLLNAVTSSCRAQTLFDIKLVDEVCAARRLHNASFDSIAKKLVAASAARGLEVALKPEQLAAVYRARTREMTVMEDFVRIPSTHFCCAVCRRGARLIIVDGNFKVWHFKSATRANSSEWENAVCGAPGTANAFFASSAQVDAILTALHTAKVADGMPESCGPTRVKAMEGVAQSGRSAMDVTGMFSACCPHGIYLRAFDFAGGEKGSYPLAMYQLVGIPAKILVGDSLCRCGKCFERARQLCAQIKKALPEGTSWIDLPDEIAVNVMHVLAHCMQCQIEFSLRHTLGAGLHHGETQEQLFAVLVALAKTLHNMSPANRQDRITLACKDSNEEWKARQALLMVTQFATASLALPTVSSKLLACGQALGLFALSATALPDDWRQSAQIAVIMVDVVAKLAKDSSTVDVHIAESADIMAGLTRSQQEKRRAAIRQTVHSVEYQCLFLVYRGSTPTAQKQQRADANKERVALSVKKKLAKLDALTSADVRYTLTGSTDALASDRHVAQCLAGSFPWRTAHNDRALHTEVIRHLRLYFLVHRFDRVTEELVLSPQELDVLVAETEVDVQVQRATVERCTQRMQQLLGGQPAAAAPPLLGAHVDPALERIASTSAAAFGAVRAATQGLAWYTELRLRALAAQLVLADISTGRVLLDARVEVRRQLHKLMQARLPDLRAECGLPRRSPSGVLSAYAKAGPARMARTASAAEDDDDDATAELARAAKPADYEPELYDLEQNGYHGDGGDVDDDGGYAGGYVDDDGGYAGGYVDDDGGYDGSDVDDDGGYDGGDGDDVDDEGGGGGLPDSASPPLPARADEPFVPAAFDSSPAASAPHPAENNPTHCSLILGGIDAAVLAKAESLLVPGACDYFFAFSEFRSTTPFVRGGSVRWLLGLGNGAGDQRPKQLDDEVVNGYATALIPAFGQDVRERAVIFTSLFWAGVFGQNEEIPLGESVHLQIVRRVRKRDDFAQLLDKELIIFPINCEASTHWVASCINLRCRRFEIFDSYHQDRRSQLVRTRFVLQSLYLAIYGKPCNLDSWTDVSWASGRIPTQVDGYNCGIFMLYNISSLARGVPIQLGLAAALATWPSSLNIRKRILCELLSGKLLLDSS